MFKRSLSRGFTLIELMVTISIGAILMSLGVPMMRNLIERNAVSGQVNSFVGAVQLARSEAIKRGIQVVVCRSANAETSNTPTCAASGTGWESGWIVFADRNTNEQMSWSSGDSDVLLRVQGAITDSGGIQEVATFLKIPCLTLRDSFERPETLTHGTNTLCGLNEKLVVKKIRHIFEGKYKKGRIPRLMDGKAAKRIVKAIKTRLK